MLELDYESKKSKYNVAVFLFIIAFLFFTYFFVNITTTYNYFISFKCSSNNVGRCVLEQTSLKKHDKKIIPLSIMNDAIVKVYKVSGSRGSTSIYHDLILKTARGDIPVVTRDANSNRINLINNSAVKINDFIKKKTDSVDIVVDRQKSLNAMIIGYGFISVILIACFALSIFLDKRKRNRRIIIHKKNDNDLGYNSEEDETVKKEEKTEVFNVAGNKIVFKINTSFKINKKSK